VRSWFVNFADVPFFGYPTALWAVVPKLVACGVLLLNGSVADSFSVRAKAIAKIMFYSNIK
jgi:hypothetical protein